MKDLLQILFGIIAFLAVILYTIMLYVGIPVLIIWALIKYIF